MHTPVLTFQHGNANFDELVVWFMCALEVLTACYTPRNTLRLAANIQGAERLRLLVGTIKTEQPSPADGTKTAVTHPSESVLATKN